MKNDVGKNPQSAPVKINLVVDGGKNPTIRPRAISFSGSQQAQASCNLTCFHDAYRAVITVMGEPNSGIARGELRSTLSRAGSCRSSGQHQWTTTGQGSNGVRMQRQKRADNCRHMKTKNMDKTGGGAGISTKSSCCPIQ